MSFVNMALDCYSFFVLSAIVSWALFSKAYKEKVNYYFLMVCISNMLMALGDGINWICQGMDQPWKPVLLTAGAFLYYAAAAGIQLYYTLYIHTYIAAQKGARKRTACIAAALIVLELVFICLFPKLGISQLFPFIIYMINLAVILRNALSMGMRKTFFLLFCMLLPGTAQLIGIQDHGIALLNAAVTFSLLAVFINLQMEREIKAKGWEAELSEMRLKLTASQIKPHFVFNVLTAIRQLCDRDPAQAKASITDFARFLRYNINNMSKSELIAFEQELQYVQAYLHLEKQRFQERLNVIYEIGCSSFFLPALTVQPLVENAVLHGIMKKNGGGGTITVRTEEKEGWHEIQILDDGVGMEIEREQTYGGEEHVGIRNVARRLELMCSGTLQIESVPGKGTKAVIRIPKA